MFYREGHIQSCGAPMAHPNCQLSIILSIISKFFYLIAQIRRFLPAAPEPVFWLFQVRCVGAAYARAGKSAAAECPLDIGMKLTVDNV